jgi:hypothetical protein
MPATLQDSRKIAESIPATDLIGVLGWEQLRDQSKYVRIARVPMIDEHDHPRKGKVDRKLLEVIAENTNERCDKCLFPLLMIGHTRYDDDERSQPEPIGVLANFRVEEHDGKKCLFADEFVQVDKIDTLSTYPRRSIERMRSDSVPENNWIDCVAALRQAAERPIALVCKYRSDVPTGAVREHYAMDLSAEQYDCGKSHEKKDKPFDHEKLKKGLKALRAKYAGSGLQMQAGSAGLNPITDPQPNVSALPQKTRKQEEIEKGPEIPGPPEMGVGDAPELAPPPEKIEYRQGPPPIDYRSVRRGLSRIRAKRRLGMPEGRRYRGPSVNTKALGQSRSKQVEEFVEKAQQYRLSRMDAAERERYLLGTMALGAAAVAAKPLAKAAGKIAGAVAPEGLHAAAGAVKNVLPKAKPPTDGETPSPTNVPHWLGQGQKESGEIAKKGAELAARKGAGIGARAAGVAAAAGGAAGYLGAGAAKKAASFPGEVGRAFAEGWKSKDPTREIHWTEHPQFAGVKSGIDRTVAQTKGWKKDPATGRMARDPERAAQASKIVSHQIDQILSGELDPRNADPIAASAARRITSDPSHVGFGQIRARPAKGAQAPGSAREIDAFFGQAKTAQPQPQPQAGQTPQQPPQGPQVGPAGRSATMAPQQPQQQAPAPPQQQQPTPQQPQAPADPFAGWVTDKRVDPSVMQGLQADQRMFHAVDDILRRGGFGKGYGVPASQAADFRATAEALATHIKQQMGDANARMANPKEKVQQAAPQSLQPAPIYQPNPQPQPAQQPQPQQPAPAQPGVETLSTPQPAAPAPETRPGVHVIGQPDARGKQVVRVVTDDGLSVQTVTSAADAARAAAGDPVALKHFKDQANERVAKDPSAAGLPLAPPPPGPRAIPAKPGAVQAGLTDAAGNSHAVEFPSTAAARLYEYARLREAMADPANTPEENDFYRKIDDSYQEKFRDIAGDRDTLHAMSLKYASQVNRAFEDADYLGTSDRPVMAPDSDALGEGFDDDLPEEYQDSDSPLAGAARAMGAPFGKSPQQAYADMRMSERKAAPDPALARLSTGIMAGSGNPGVYGFDPYSVSTDSVAATKAAKSLLARMPANTAKDLLDDKGRLRGVPPEKMNEYHRQQAGSTDHEPGWAGPQATALIRTAPSILQYKDRHDPASGSTGSIPQGTPYDPGKSGVLRVWKATSDIADPADPSKLAVRKGQVYVIDGHNKLESAMRGGSPYVNVIYSNAASAAEARLEGAMQNILGGTGSPLDAAKVFRELGASGGDARKRLSAFAREHGMSLDSGVAGEGMALANLPDWVYGLLRQESPLQEQDRRLPHRFAAMIGGSGLAPSQMSMFASSYLHGGKSEADIAAEIHAIKNPRTTGGQIYAGHKPQPHPLQSRPKR